MPLATFDLFADQQLGPLETAANGIAQTGTAIDHKYLSTVSQLGADNADLVFTAAWAVNVLQSNVQMGNAR